jgi:hypothetical protein
LTDIRRVSGSGATDKLRYHHVARKFPREISELRAVLPENTDCVAVVAVVGFAEIDKHHFKSQ